MKLKLLIIYVLCLYRPVTGASMNPARSIGPAIVSQEYNALWIYIVSPTLGAVSGACFYNLVRTSSKPK